MFKLRRLEITGFKSFADHTDLIFTGDGITAIVGPNGCGKSNVADAIAWVLGEQRVKHLRGAEMKDVIFQGSRNRTPNGMAEVVLHLVRDEYVESEPDIQEIDETLEEIDDRITEFEAPEIEAAPETAAVVSADTFSETSNPDGANSEALISSDQAPDDTSQAKPKVKAHHHRHWRRRNLALQFAPGEAVTVTRRLFRSGESEYLLNDRLCRLRDIQDVFSGKPMDRRTIIEEAAGITKFRVRQRAAESRLESARANLSRVSDIISEIERQVNSLRRQAAKARRYAVQREELRELLRRVYVAEEINLKTLLAETQAQLDQASEDEQRLATELSERDEAGRAATQNARTLEDGLAQLRAAIADAALQRDRRIRERVYQEEQIETLLKRRAEIEREVEALNERRSVFEAELERVRQLDAQLSAENEKATA